MYYSVEQIESLSHEFDVVQSELQELLLSVVMAGEVVLNAQAKEYLLHGVGRRTKVLRRCILNVFELFPLTRREPISSDDLDEVQINLHAFVMNLYGFFENSAWAFVLRHGLRDQIGDRKHIGLFLARTQQYLPDPLKTYMTSRTMALWHADYLKNYRDALAHRIPLYIPPAAFTPETGKRYSELEEAKAPAIRNHDWDVLDRIYAEQASLGTAYPAFLHSLDENAGPKPVLLHPQMLCDAKTVLEFGNLFLKQWHQRTKP
jgi:hypothetical protein